MSYVDYVLWFVDFSDGTFFRLTLALFLGLVLGLERVVAGKMVGMRTFGLVSLAACLLVVSDRMMGLDLGLSAYDPSRMGAAIVTGIGFLGAGLIIFLNDKVVGLTSAAGLWVSAAVGLAVGNGAYGLASFATFITLFVFTGVWYLERLVKEKVEEEHHQYH